jgi:predicted phosphodiesterase
MRIGLFGDIHGNLVALDAVLAALRHERLDHLVCLGDVATTGPQPHETVARLRELGCVVVRGNWDDWMLEIRDGRRSPDGCRPMDLWCGAQLTAADLRFLDTFLPTYELPLPNGTALVCYHGAPRDYNQYLSYVTPDEELDRVLEGRRTGIMAGGHTHMAMLRRHRQALVLNPGSVSENWNFSRWPQQRLFNPHAEYAVVDCDAGQVRVTFQQVAIDVEAVIAAAYACGMPAPEPWVASWQRTPSERRGAP